MDIFKVVGPLVCTQRHDGLQKYPLQVLRDTKGKIQVATDTVGCHPGNWVFTISGSAARLGCGDPKVLTDLTVGGIMDWWDEETGQV